MPKRVPILRPLLLAIFLALGGGIALGFCVAWCADMAVRWAQMRDVRDIVSEGLRVDAKGTPLIRRYLGGREQEHRTLEGQIVRPNDREGWLMGSILAGPETRARYIGVRFDHWMEWTQRIIAFTDANDPSTYWYFVHDGEAGGRGYFVAFDSVSKLRTGYLGRKGFSADLPPREDWFPVARWQMLSRAAFGHRVFGQYGNNASAFGQLRAMPAEESHYYRIPFMSDGQLLEVDFRARTIRVLLQSSEIVSIDRSVGAQPSKREREAETETPPTDLAVRLSDRIRVLDRKTGKTRDYVLPSEVRDRELTFYELLNGTALLETSPWAPTRTIYRIDAGGKILQRAEIRPGNPRQFGPRIRDWAVVAAVPCPLVEIPSLFFLRQDLPYRQRVAIVVGEYQFWAGFAYVTLFAAVLAWLTYRRQRRYALPWTWVWVPLVFLIGLPGYLGYICHRRWPVLEPCPTCEKAAPRDRNACAYCRTEFPRPAPKGIEVFA